MGAFREWYFARDGVGHANRPWFHDAIGLDAQSRRLCLSSARRRRYSHSNPYSDTNGNSHCDGNSNSDGYGYGYSNTWSEVYSHTEATSHATAATVSSNFEVIRCSV